MSTFALEVAYSQISVFQSSLRNPFNDWTDIHVAQGFSWRPGSVSFRTLDGEGRISVSVKKATTLEVSSLASRAILVPFEIPNGVSLEVATIVESVGIDLDSGDYMLLFEHGRYDDGEMWCNFRFVPGVAKARVVRADAELHPGEELLMDAAPAAP